MFSAILGLLDATLSLSTTVTNGGITCATDYKIKRILAALPSEAFGICTNLNNLIEFRYANEHIKICLGGIRWICELVEKRR